MAVMDMHARLPSKALEIHVATEQMLQKSTLWQGWMPNGRTQSGQQSHGMIISSSTEHVNQNQALACARVNKVKEMRNCEVRHTNISNSNKVRSTPYGLWCVVR